ncbi:MAG: cbb3-type cytochrome c oxidase subunit 3 [Pseudomonadota bacterium]
MTYEEVARFSETWGLVLLVVLFSIAVVYALWPGNKDKFRRAAHLPLSEDDERPDKNSERG